MIITHHAVDRFRQRFERTSYEAAKHGVELMVQESRGLTFEEMRWLRANNLLSHKSFYLYHDYSGILSVLKFEGPQGQGEPMVITLWPLKFGQPAFQRYA